MIAVHPPGKFPAMPNPSRPKTIGGSAAYQPGGRPLPGYIRACFHNPDPARPTYWVYVWPKNTPDPAYVTRLPFTCNSWRCPFGVCAEHEAHVLFARMCEAFEPFQASDMVFVVLTLDGRDHGRPRHTLADLYRDLRRRVEKFQRNMRVFLERQTVDGKPVQAYRSSWVATVEAHKDGTPHINLLIACPSFARWVSQWVEGNRALGLDDKESTLLVRFGPHNGVIGKRLRALIAKADLGWRCTADVAKDREKMVGYIGKIARNAEHTHAELAKVSQLPFDAPKGHRRLRSGRGFLPPRRKGDNTGTILRRVVSAEGDEEIRPLVRSKDPDYCAIVERCCAIEQELAIADEAHLRPGDKIGTRGTRAVRSELTRTLATGLAALPADAPASILYGETPQAARERESIGRMLRVGETERAEREAAAGSLTLPGLAAGERPG